MCKFVVRKVRVMFVARQPIFDKRMKVYGYELLFYYRKLLIYSIGQQESLSQQKKSETPYPFIIWQIQVEDKRMSESIYQIGRCFFYADKEVVSWQRKDYRVLQIRQFFCIMYSICFSWSRTIWFRALSFCCDTW